MRVLVAIIVVLAVVVAALAQARPTLAKTTLFEIGIEHLVDLMAAGCGPGWHWSNRRGWNWVTASSIGGQTEDEPVPSRDDRSTQPRSNLTNPNLSCQRLMKGTSRRSERY
jgi:hypothetical protein